MVNHFFIKHGHVGGTVVYIYCMSLSFSYLRSLMRGSEAFKWRFGGMVRSLNRVFFCLKGLLGNWQFSGL